MFYRLSKRIKHCSSNSGTKEMFDDVWQNVWEKSNFVKHRPTSSNIVKHGGQTSKTCFIKQCWMIFYSFRQAFIEKGDFKEKRRSLAVYSKRKIIFSLPLLFLAKNLHLYTRVINKETYNSCLFVSQHLPDEILQHILFVVLCYWPLRDNAGRCFIKCTLW